MGKIYMSEIYICIYIYMTKSRFQQIERHLLFLDRELNIPKMSILPKVIFVFNIILIKIQTIYVATKVHTKVL